MDNPMQSQASTNQPATSSQHNAASMKYAVIFPGQGSQGVGMLNDWAAQYPIVKATFDEASKALGFDLWAICQGASGGASLDDTAYTQPALLTASMAIWRVLRDELDLQPAYVAGHSLGEYSALCAAGVLSLADAVKLVHQRGQYMSAAMQSQTGKMAAILGLPDEDVQQICDAVVAAHTQAVVSPANFNAPGQVVIAGNVAGVDLASEKIVALGKKSMPLKVSVPSHCQLMTPATDKLAAELENVTFNPPSIPVIQNRHARVENDVTALKQALIEQLNMSVLWSTIENKLADAQISLQIECGSGSVLTGLAKRQAQKITTLATDTVAKLDNIKQQLSAQ